MAGIIQNAKQTVVKKKRKNKQPLSSRESESNEELIFWKDRSWASSCRISGVGYDDFRKKNKAELGNRYWQRVLFQTLWPSERKPKKTGLHSCLKREQESRRWLVCSCFAMKEKSHEISIQQWQTQRLGLLQSMLLFYKEISVSGFWVVGVHASVCRVCGRRMKVGCLSGPPWQMQQAQASCHPSQSWPTSRPTPQSLAILASE